MSKIIEGIPESFTREQYVALFDAVGVDPYNVESLEFRAEGVYVVVFECDDQGERILLKNGDGDAKHRIFVPVEGGLPKREDFRSGHDHIWTARLCDAHETCETCGEQRPLPAMTGGEAGA